MSIRVQEPAPRRIIGYRVKDSRSGIHVTRCGRNVATSDGESDPPDPLTRPEALHLLADWLNAGYSGRIVSVWARGGSAKPKDSLVWVPGWQKGWGEHC